MDRDRFIELAAALIVEVDQLEQWARESERGGWSTHQVEPMKKRASDLREILWGVGVKTRTSLQERAS